MSFRMPDVAVVAERDERAVGPVLHVVDVREVERQFADGEARHEHLHRRRVLRRARAVRRRPAPSGGRFCFSVGVLGIEVGADLLRLVVRQRAVEEQHLGDVAAGRAADFLLAGAVGVVPRADGDLGQRQRRGASTAARRWRCRPRDSRIACLSPRTSS